MLFRSGMNSVTTIELPRKVKKIEDFTFYGCDKLKTIVLPEQMESFQNSSLWGPDGTDFPLRQVEQVQLTPAQKPVLPAAGYAPYLLVGAAAAVTAALLAWFYARKRKK